MKSRVAFFAALSLAILGLPMASAQDLCREDEPIDDCQFRTGNQGLEVAAREKAEEIKPDVAAQNTGDNDNSTTNDFLPLLRLLLNGDSLSEGQKIGFEWSDPLGFGSDYPNKLTASIQEADIYEPLKKALVGAGLTEQATALDDAIDSGDDVKFGYTLGMATKNYGRDPELQKDLFAALLESVRERSPKPRTLEDAETTLGKFMTLHDLEGSTSYSSITDEAVRTEFKRLAEEQIRLKNVWLKEIAKQLKLAGFDGLIQLIDNQPQLTFSVDYEARGESVGPDEVSATLAWEFGGKSVKTFRAYARKECARDGASESEAMVACLPTYLAQAESAKESFRFKLAAEFSEVQRYEFELADPDFSFAEKSVKHLEVSAVASRQLGKPRGKAPRPRFDAKLSYEDFSDDPARQDRGLATVTFSYPVTPGFFMTLGAVYATKPEFRGDVDEEVSARLGFTYKLIEQQ